MTDATPQFVEMAMTCRVATVATRASACLIGTQEAASGQFHIVDAEDGAILDEHDVVRMHKGGPVIVERLRAPFAILVQANGRPDFTSRLTLKTDGKLIYDREATSLGMIAIDSEELGLDSGVQR
ncbi:MAG: hypothetical protein ABW169_16645 [Sphingobium sp.]